jgi:hypothetical protein
MSRALVAIYPFSIVKVEFLYITIVMDDLIQCTSCSRLPQPREEFINSRHKLCKLCNKCRSKHNKRRSKQSVKEYTENWREENKERVLELSRKASNAWVQREKEKDAEAYYAKLRLKHRKSAPKKIREMEKNAPKRNLKWELPYEVALQLVTTACVYCGFLDLTKTVNSIDRLDSAKNYTIDNCVACCVHCNMMKGCYDPTTFVERCRKIGECQLQFNGISKCDLIKTSKRTTPPQ